MTIEIGKPPEPPKSSLMTRVIVALIFLLLGPIMWVASKIKGSGCGAGPALASFMMATVLVLGGVAVLATGTVVLVAYLAN